MSQRAGEPLEGGRREVESVARWLVRRFATHATGLKLSFNFQEPGEALEIIYNINCVYQE